MHEISKDLTITRSQKIMMLQNSYNRYSSEWHEAKKCYTLDVTISMSRAKVYSY